METKSVHPHWIVGRSLCMYRCESFHNVPRAKRSAALALKLPVWSPFEHTGHYAVWAGPLAMVWLWNQADVEAVRRDHPALPAASGVRVLPETIFFPQPADGVHVRECAEGYDLQRWQGRILRDAYWLAEQPTRETLAWFVDRQPSDVSTERLLDATFLPPRCESEPWAGRETPAQWVLAREGVLVATGMLALLLPLAWQEARVWKMHGLAQAAAAEMTRMQAEIDPMLGAREEWLGLRERNRTLAAVLAEPSQAYLMSLVDQAIPSADASLHSWRYQQRELRFVVEDANLDPVDYTRALQAQPLFDQVRMQPLRRSGQFEITLEVAVEGGAE